MGERAPHRAREHSRAASRVSCKPSAARRLHNTRPTQQFGADAAVVRGSKGRQCQWAPLRDRRVLPARRSHRMDHPALPPIPLAHQRNPMNLPKLSRELTTAVALIALLAVTRIGHFGGFNTPPDASLAVFFLLGLWIASPRWLVVALLAAAATDALAIAQGASSYCITPAYPLLIPTYGVLWGAGRATSVYAARRQAWLRGPVLGVALVTSTAIAFLVSNASFYASEGRSAALPAGEFA